MSKYLRLREEVLRLGKECAVQITGFPEDADDIMDSKIAFDAIKECIRLGIERNNELNALRLSLARDNEKAT